MEGKHDNRFTTDVDEKGCCQYIMYVRTTQRTFVQVGADGR